MATTSNAVAPAGSSNPSAFDQRLIEVDVVLPGKTYTFAGPAAIVAFGSKFGNANMNTCECRVYNLTRALQNTILTLASPLLAPPPNNPAPKKRVPVVLNLRVGRASTGTFLLFTGMVFSCEMTQPPDVGIVLRSLTNDFNTSIAAGLAPPPVTQLSEIAQAVAQQNGLFLDFEATDRQVSNYNFTGPLQYHVNKLNQIGGIHAGVDNDTLWVTDADKARKNTGFVISESTGMVGIPQVTSQGVVARVMIDPAVQIGGSVTIKSAMNPAANGSFKVMKIDYEVATRDQPFWYTILASNLAVFQGAEG